MSTATHSLRSWRQQLAQQLQGLSAEPTLEAERWLCRGLGWRRARLYAELDRSVDWDWDACAWARRLAGEPLAYIWGEIAFHGVDLQITPDVLIPRPDTECLVDAVLSEHGPALRQVLDLGTGSGAIALALQQARPQWQITGTDASPAALRVAHANGVRCGLPVQWLEANWFDGLPAQHRWHLIVANPPYLAEEDPHLPDLRHEPRTALISGTDGLDAIRHIVAHAAEHLHPQGALYLEHGSTQAADVAALLALAGFASVRHAQDTGGHLRVTWGVHARGAG